MGIFNPTYHIHLNITLPGADGSIRIEQKIDKMANELDNLTTEVSETKTVMASAVTLLQGLKAKLDEAGTDATKLAALSAELDTSTNALAAAITANTPADNGNSGTGETPTEPQP